MCILFASTFNEYITIELSSSEWKKLAIREAVILKQQTVNLKTNAYTLSTLCSIYGSQFKGVLAIIWIGHVRYTRHLIGSIQAEIFHDRQKHSAQTRIVQDRYNEGAYGHYQKYSIHQ